MRELYIKSLQRIKENKITNRKDYHKLAKKENLLNAESMQFISGKRFKTLCMELNKN